MPYKANVIKVMIATPGDVDLDRKLIRDTIYGWNIVHSEDKDLVLLPVVWDSHASPTMGDRPQAIINKQVLKDCDLLVAVFWTRLGTPTGKSVSGTVEEIEEHLEAGKPAMIYFSSAPVLLESVDEKQYQALQKFKAECRHRGLIEEFVEPSEFKEKFSRQLAQTVLRRFLKKNGPPSESDLAMPRQSVVPKLSLYAKRLLQEGAQDSRGIITRSHSTHGISILTNDSNLAEDYGARNEAKWEIALRELRENELIQERGTKSGTFSVTNEGYEIANLLPRRIALATP